MSRMGGVLRFVLSFVDRFVLMFLLPNSVVGPEPGEPESWAEPLAHAPLSNPNNSQVGFMTTPSPQKTTPAPGRQ